MLEVNKKKSFYTTIPLFKSNRAFTLVEVLIGLTIFSTLMLLLPTIFRFVELDNHTDELAVRQFFHFVTDEIHSNSIDRINTNSIQLRNNGGDKITISKYNDLIRRQVNGTGHEILLRNVNHFTVVSLSNGLHLTIQSQNGDTYEKIIAYY
ncbi:competence type IV pilus minor pilin ComGF [Natronobacillus azotifigens]|uniref:competence type IV pilus minor pilin ComGF n=1 Tax=Natronobacillus azotifigens TaxID=472978 RepID=UPI003AF09F77